MSSLAELEAAHANQGTKVAELKAVDKTSDAAKAAVQELLRIKREITALDPDHKFAIKKKEKKKKKWKGPACDKEGAQNPEEAGSSTEESRGGGHGQSQTISGRTWTRG